VLEKIDRTKENVKLFQSVQRITEEIFGKEDQKSKLMNSDIKKITKKL